MKITWITDVHLDAVNSVQYDEFLDKLASLKSDALFVTGDTSNALRVFQDLQSISTRVEAPTYFVLGNHDYYGSSIDEVRERAHEYTFGVDAPSKLYTSPSAYSNRPYWLPVYGPVRLAHRGAVLIGVDGWGDGRCGNAETSPIVLNDWYAIADFKLYGFDDHRFRGRRAQGDRLEKLRALGDAEALLLALLLDKANSPEKLFVLTHVPPFPQSSFYNGAMSSPDFLPWFVCVKTGEVLIKYAQVNPATQVTVLCGHSHGKGTYQPLPNLLVRTGGWEPGERDYGNPVIQDILEI
jgi:predicted phosphohydrolase